MRPSEAHKSTPISVDRLRSTENPDHSASSRAKLSSGSFQSAKRSGSPQGIEVRSTSIFVVRRIFPSQLKIAFSFVRFYKNREAIFGNFEEISQLLRKIPKEFFVATFFREAKKSRTRACEARARRAKRVDSGPRSLRLLQSDSSGRAQGRTIFAEQKSQLHSELRRKFREAKFWKATHELEFRVKFAKRISGGAKHRRCCALFEKIRKFRRNFPFYRRIFSPLKFAKRILENLRFSQIRQNLPKLTWKNRPQIF